MPGTTTTKTDEAQQIAKYWNDIANDFDAIYTGNKGFIGRGLDQAGCAETSTSAMNG